MLKLLMCVRVLSMEIRNEFFGTFEVGERFPRVVLAGVSFPRNEVMKLFALSFRIEDGFDFVVRLVIYDHGVRGQGSFLFSESGGFKEGEQRFMEDGVDCRPILR